MLVVRRSVQRTPERVQEEMEQLFRSMMPGRPQVGTRQHRLWRPPIEVFETEHELVVTVEIPGLSEESLNVVIENDLLVIQGERLDCRDGERRIYREAGIAYGEFGANVYLPFPVDADRTDAGYENGFLRIKLPKVSARTIVPRRVGDAESTG
jgi:HSP20 family protein